MKKPFLVPGRRRFLALGLGACGALALGAGAKRAAGASRAQYRFAGVSMASPYHVSFIAPLGEDRLQHAARGAVEAAFNAVDRRMSTFDPGSEIARLNRHTSPDAVELSEETFRVLAEARRVSLATGGAFDVTAGPLVNAWGFGPVKAPRIPARAELARLRDEVGFGLLELDAGARAARKANPGMHVDLSGIAKGYGVDQAAQALDRLGVGDYVIELGGELIARGRNARGEPWRAGIEEPQAGPPVPRSVVPLDGLAMATSGDYRIFFERDGRRYCHEIDPVSGEPVRHRLTQVTVIAKDCTSADAFATALMVLGPDAGHALAERIGVAAHFIARAGHGGALEERATGAFAALRPFRLTA